MTNPKKTITKIRLVVSDQHINGNRRWSLIRLEDETEVASLRISPAVAKMLVEYSDILRWT